MNSDKRLFLRGYKARHDRRGSLFALISSHWLRYRTSFLEAVFHDKHGYDHTPSAKTLSVPGPVPHKHASYHWYRYATPYHKKGSIDRILRCVGSRHHHHPLLFHR